MPNFTPSQPATPRDHEILALTNELCKCCGHHNYGVILAALAQTFIATVREFGVGPLPDEIQVVAQLLSEISETVRELPQDSVQ